MLKRAYLDFGENPETGKKEANRRLIKNEREKRKKGFDMPAI
jgi:hypothetical protein